MKVALCRPNCPEWEQMTKVRRFESWVTFRASEKIWEPVRRFERVTFRVTFCHKSLVLTKPGVSGGGSIKSLRSRIVQTRHCPTGWQEGRPLKISVGRRGGGGLLGFGRGGVAWSQSHSLAAVAWLPALPSVR